MTIVGGDFITAFAGASAIVLAACGLFLIFLDVNQSIDPGPFRRRLMTTATWLSGLGMRNLGRETIRATSRSIDRFVYYWFEQSERNLAVTGVFTVVVLVGIPLASLVNAVRGGSPFLLVVVIFCILGICALAILGELRRLPGVARLLAPLLFVVMFIFLPGYAFWSLTDRMRFMPIGHAALVSLLVAPILYVTCQSIVLGIAGTWGAFVPSARATIFRRVVTYFASTLPVAYLFLFAALIAGHFAVPELPQPKDWTVLIGTVVATAGSGALTMHFMAERRARVRTVVLKSVLTGVVLAYGLAWIAGFMPKLDPLVLSPLFWLVHLPLLAPLGLVALLAMTVAAKGALTLISGVAGPEAATARPYFVSGSIMILVAAVAGWAAAIL